MTTTRPIPAGWHPDPTGRCDQRFWDGAKWTEHVVVDGRPAVSPLDGAWPVDTTAPHEVVRQVRKAGVAPASGGSGHLLDEPVLVVNQQAQFIGGDTEFAVYDQHGRQLGWVVQVGKSPLSNALGRILREVDKLFTPRFEVRDMHGLVLFTLTRPTFSKKDLVHPRGERVLWSTLGGRFQVKSMHLSVIVAAPDGPRIGTIWHESRGGPLDFSFEVDGRWVGGIKVEDWRAWNFALVDAQGDEIGRITKTWQGLVKAAFTDADNYVVQIHQPLADPLRTLVVASALAVDCVLKQGGGALVK